jgi:putative transposase
MSTRKVVLSTGEYYHVYNRGNSKQAIFLDVQDKKRFVKLLGLLNQPFRVRIDEDGLMRSFSKKEDNLVAIGAYVLMDNHFHILLKQTVDGGVTSFMQKISTAYAMYFNKKYNRTGGLFEGAFKSQHADNDIYLKYLYAYIHLNPAKMVDPTWKQAVVQKRKDAIDFIKQYPYSSFHDYCGIGREEKALLSPHEFPFYFKNTRDFTESILSWIQNDTNSLQGVPL